MGAARIISYIANLPTREQNQKQSSGTCFRAAVHVIREHVVDAFGELIVGVSMVFLFVGVVLVGDAEETGDDEGEVLFAGCLMSVDVVFVPSDVVCVVVQSMKIEWMEDWFWRWFVKACGVVEIHDFFVEEIVG